MVCRRTREVEPAVTPTGSRTPPPIGRSARVERNEREVTHACCVDRVEERVGVAEERREVGFVEWRWGHRGAEDCRERERSGDSDAAEMSRELLSRCGVA